MRQIFKLSLFDSYAKLSITPTFNLAHTPLERHGPVRLPGDTAVRREGLLPGWIRFGMGPPNKANVNWLSVQRVLGQERADVTAKTTYNGFVHAVRCASVQPPDGPAQSLRIVGSKGSGTYLPVREEEDVVFDVPVTAEDFSR